MKAYREEGSVAGCLRHNATRADEGRRFATYCCEGSERSGQEAANPWIP